MNIKYEVLIPARLDVESRKLQEKRYVKDAVDYRGEPIQAYVIKNSTENLPVAITSHGRVTKENLSDFIREITGTAFGYSNPHITASFKRNYTGIVLKGYYHINQAELFHKMLMELAEFLK